MPKLLVREFEVQASLERCWEHLARVEEWPSWARHIRSIELTPPRGLTPSTTGRIRLKNGVRSSFAMTDLRPGERWEWAGKFLWLMVRYDHVFVARSGDTTDIRFEVAVDGPGAGSIGRFFAFIYAKSLDRAIPNLVAEIEGR